MANQVGEDVVAYCTKYKNDLDHVIVALVEEKVKKVLCKTSKKEHVYKTPKGDKTPKKNHNKSQEKEGISRRRMENGNGTDKKCNR